MTTPTSRPVVSLILPVYNVDKYIEKCLESIRTQTLRNIEVIMVDDGSKDESPAICNRYAELDSRFQVIHKENGGAASARNLGLEHATGKWIAFIDPDDFIEPDYCRRAVEAGENKVGKRANLYEQPDDEDEDSRNSFASRKSDNDYRKNQSRKADDILNIRSVSGSSVDELRDSGYGNTTDIDSFDIVMFDAWEDGRRGGPRPWEHADYDFSTTDSIVIGKLCCAMLYQKMSPYKTDVPLAAPWDKLYRADFLKKYDLKFPTELKVLDDMTFNFQAFHYAENVTYIHEKLYHYCFHEASITHVYNPKRLERDMQAFDYLRKLIEDWTTDWPHADLFAHEGVVKPSSDGLWQAYYARVIKSFAILTKLYFFAKGNENPRSAQFEEARRVMRDSTYLEAFTNIKPHLLEGKLKMVLKVVKMHNPRLLYLLYLLQKLVE